MNGDRWLTALTVEDIRRELTRLNIEAAAKHHPGPDGVCPQCKVRLCERWTAALRVLRSAGVVVPMVPVCDPVRPQWWCERHDAPWPCAVARGLLSDAYGLPGRSVLMVYLAGLMVDAAWECGTPADELVERFVTWVVRQW